MTVDRLEAPPTVGIRTDALVPGLGRVEQLVLRGDGLTTTSLEILSGRTVTTMVRAHWQLPLHPQAGIMRSGAGRDGDQYAGDPPSDPGRWAQVGFTTLQAGVADELLIREIDLVGDGTLVLAAATVVAVLGVLPLAVAHRLGTTDEPIGRLLAAENVQVRRELARWGLRPVGHLADRLGVPAEDLVPARSYLMRAVPTGRPLAMIEEWFAPALFADQQQPAHRRSSAPLRRRFRSNLRANVRNNPRTNPRRAV